MVPITLLWCATWTAMFGDPSTPSDTTVRFAVFNIWELSAAKIDEVDDEGHGANPQLRHAAAIIQRIRPDVLLINEIDFDEAGRNAIHFRDRYLKFAQAGLDPVNYPYVFVAPVNTGVPTGRDLDNDGKTDGPGDAYGFGRYPGQYGMALYSRFPIDADGARTFQKFLWKDMPKNLMPDGTNGKPAFYSATETAIFRLSSKSHWDVPVRIGRTVVHVLAAHPTPPVFDGAEDRNGRRAFDEIRLWADYLTGGEAASYLVDDRGQRGGLPKDAPFVILGDMNADPVLDPARYGQPAIYQLLKHPWVQDPMPQSDGAAAHAKDYPGDKATRTCDFGRIDYGLPCKDLKVAAAGMYWPPPKHDQADLVRNRQASSDHRLVWVDIELGVESAEPQPPPVP